MDKNHKNPFHSTTIKESCFFQQNNSLLIIRQMLPTILQHVLLKNNKKTQESIYKIALIGLGTPSNFSVTSIITQLYFVLEVSFILLFSLSHPHSHPPMGGSNPGSPNMLGKCSTTDYIHSQKGKFLLWIIQFNKGLINTVTFYNQNTLNCNSVNSKELSKFLSSKNSFMQKKKKKCLESTLISYDKINFQKSHLYQWRKCCCSGENRHQKEDYPPKSCPN